MLRAATSLLALAAALAGPLQPVNLQVEYQSSPTTDIATPRFQWEVRVRDADARENVAARAPHLALAYISH